MPGRPWSFIVSLSVMPEAQVLFSLSQLAPVHSPGPPYESSALNLATHLPSPIIGVNFT